MENLKKKYLEALREYPFDSAEEAAELGLKDVKLAERDTFTALDTPYTMRSLVRKRTESAAKKIDYIEDSSSSGESTNDSPFYDDLHLKIDLFVKGKQIVDDCELTIQRNHKYGLVGRNGIGKTTLIKAIRKRKFGIPKGLTMHAIRQDYVSDEKVIDYVGADAQRALKGLGFTEAQYEKTIRSLSGGWRMRAQLAKAIHLGPDLVLLDEPTNFLDLKAIAYLEKQVENMKTVIIVSHDKEFLDRTVDHVLHMNDMKIDVYDGNYSKFRDIRREKINKLVKEYENDMAQREHIQSFIDRFRYNASKAAQAQSRIKILEKMPKIVPPKIDPVIKFSFPSTPIRGTILELTNVSFDYNKMEDLDNNNSLESNTNSSIDNKTTVEGNKNREDSRNDSIDYKIKGDGNISKDNSRNTSIDDKKNKSGKNAVATKSIFTDLNLRIVHNSRIVVVGDNGQGKSTLLKLIARAIKPKSGLIESNPSLRIGYFAQHHVDHLDHNEHVLSFLMKRCREEEARAVLGRFGLNVGNQLIGTLSGGQKSRLAFALLSLDCPNLLILDEPTNHLDMETIEALALAVSSFDGAVICVSHDLAFIQQAFKDVYVCENGGLSWFRGTALDYKESIKASL